MTSGGSRRMTVSWRDVDQQAGVERLLDELAARAVELDADHQAHAADRHHAADAGQRLAEGRCGSASPRAVAFCHQAVALDDAQRLERRRGRRAVRRRRSCRGCPGRTRPRPVRARARRRSARRNRDPWRASARRERLRPLVAEPLAGAADAATAPRRSSAASPSRRTSGAARARSRHRRRGYRLRPAAPRATPRARACLAPRCSRPRRDRCTARG